MATTWNPLNAMEALHRDIERAVGNEGVANEPFSRVAFLPGRAARRYPMINLSEDPDHVYVEALAPGIDVESLALAVIRNVLSISGEKRRTPDNIPPEAFHRNERAAGKFVRTIDLPVEVDADQVTASYQHGLLRVTMAKAEAAKPKQITVTTVA
ncbi:MAG: Hsp20/alpha crystallin family protein [Planctomycetota bacterium]|jgi:HSP20 family protein